jgi:hypothetical protein
MWIEAVAVKLKVLFQHAPGGTEEEHKNSASFTKNVHTGTQVLGSLLLSKYQNYISDLEAAKY